jgi:opacity protein-like surface antigen
MKKFIFATLAMLVMVLNPFAAPASAMPVIVQQALPSGAASPLLMDVHRRNFNSHYNYGWSGNHWRYPRYGGYGGYWRPRYYVPPCYGWGGFGCGPGFGYYGGTWLGVGPTIVLRDRHYSYGRRHVRWCHNRYRSYNARSNTWVAYSGRVRQCISPYGP